MTLVTMIDATRIQLNLWYLWQVEIYYVNLDTQGDEYQLK